MWLPGLPITIASSGVAQQLTSTLGLVKAIRFNQHWNNTHRIYWGDSTLNSATPVGVIGWLPPPTTGNPPPSEEMLEPESMNGINAGATYVEGSSGEVVLWSYLLQ